MQITFTPLRHDMALHLERQGDVLIVNGTSYDFSALPEGATLPRKAINCELLASDVLRKQGRLYLTLILPFGADAPQQTRFPAPVIDPPDGVIALPSYMTEPAHDH